MMKLFTEKIVSGLKRVEKVITDSSDNQIKKSEEHMDKLLKGFLEDSRTQIGGQNPDQIAGDLEDGNDGAADIRYRFRENIRTRIVYQTSTFLAYILETIGKFPTNDFIADGGVHAILLGGFQPCRINIYAGLILKKYDNEISTFTYRFFHASFNTRIGQVLTIRDSAEKSIKQQILEELSKDDFKSRFSSFRTNLASSWQFFSFVNILYHVNKVV